MKSTSPVTPDEANVPDSTAATDAPSSSGASADVTSPSTEVVQHIAETPTPTVQPLGAPTVAPAATPDNSNVPTARDGDGHAVNVRVALGGQAASPALADIRRRTSTPTTEAAMEGSNHSKNNGSGHGSNNGSNHGNGNGNGKKLKDQGKEDSESAKDQAKLQKRAAALAKKIKSDVALPEVFVRQYAKIQPLLLTLVFSADGETSFLEMSRDEVLKQAKRGAKSIQEEILSKGREASNAAARERGEEMPPFSISSKSIPGSMKARDVRCLDKSFAASHAPLVLVRRGAVLFSLEEVRAMVVHDRCLIFVPDGADSMLSIMMDRLRHTDDGVEYAATSVHHRPPFEFRAVSTSDLSFKCIGLTFHLFITVDRVGLFVLIGDVSFSKNRAFHHPPMHAGALRDLELDRVGNMVQLYLFGMIVSGQSACIHTWANHV
jgi:hypothetical protein